MVSLLATFEWYKANKRLSICSKEDLIYLNSAGMSRLQYSKIVLLKGNKGFLFNDYSGDCAQFYLDGEIYEGFLCCFRAKTKSIIMGAAVFPSRHIPQLSQSMEYKHKKLKSPTPEMWRFFIDKPSFI